MPNVAAPTTPFQSTTAGTGGTPKYYANQNVGGPYGWPGATFGAPGGGVPPTLPGAPGGAYGMMAPAFAPIAYPQLGGYQVPDFTAGAGGMPSGPPPGPPPTSEYGMLPGSDLAQMGAAQTAAGAAPTWEQIQAGAKQWLPADPRLRLSYDPSIAGTGGEYSVTPEGLVPFTHAPLAVTNPYSYSEMIQAAPQFDAGLDAYMAEMAALRPEDPRGVYADLLSEQMAMMGSKETAAQKQAQALAASAGLGTSGKTGADIFGIGSQYAQLAGQTMSEHERALQAASDQYTKDMRDYTSAQKEIQLAADTWAAEDAAKINTYAAGTEEKLSGAASEGFALNDEFITDWNLLSKYLTTSGVDSDSASFIMDNLLAQWQNSGFLYASNKHTFGKKKGHSLGGWQYEGFLGDESMITDELYAPSIDWGSLLGGIDYGTPDVY